MARTALQRREVVSGDHSILYRKFMAFKDIEKKNKDYVNDRES